MIKGRARRKRMVDVGLSVWLREWLYVAMGCGICVKGMAAVLRVSKRTLERRFAGLGRGSLRAWLRLQRMAVARRWLREGGRVGEVASRAWYGSVAAFCSAYWRRWCRSPGEEREQAG